MGFDHTCPQFCQFRVLFNSPGLGLCFRGIAYTIRTIYLFGNQFNLLAQWSLKIVKKVEIVFLLTRIDNRISKFQSPITTFKPMFGNGNAGACGLCSPANRCYFILGIGVKGIDANHRVDSRLFNGLDMVS